MKQYADRMVFYVFIVDYYFGRKDELENRSNRFYLVYRFQKIRKNHTFYRWRPLWIDDNYYFKREYNEYEFV